jgi:hypothetical protein
MTGLIYILMMKTSEIQLRDDCEISFTNTLDSVTPTGIEQTKKDLMVLFIALSIVFVAILKRIRKNNHVRH